MQLLIPGNGANDLSHMELGNLKMWSEKLQLLFWDKGQYVVIPYLLARCDRHSVPPLVWRHANARGKADELGKSWSWTYQIFPLEVGTK
jgi:hypothetical protein